ncbi:unnamed protein product, partial [Discosporangium mesarthrocarpum]
QATLTALPVQRIPNPPRFEMTSCCFKHQCAVAGGRTSLGQSYHSDRVDVWDGRSWSFASWGEHTLSEGRRAMGAAVLEVTLGEGNQRAVGMFVGGLSNNGLSQMVDVFDFQAGRVLPRMLAPTVR